MQLLTEEKKTSQTTKKSMKSYQTEKLKMKQLEKLNFYW